MGTPEVSDLQMLTTADFVTAQQVAEGVHELWMARLAEGWCPTPRHGRLTEWNNRQGWCADCRGWYETAQQDSYIFVMELPTDVASIRAAVEQATANPGHTVA